MKIFTIFSFASLLSASTVEAFSTNQHRTSQTTSRREALITSITSAAALILTPKEEARAATFGDVTAELQNSGSMPKERLDLLNAINRKASDDEVMQAISNIELIDPSNGKAATSEFLGGEWELIYSVNAESFSPLLNLPKPIRPSSFQLLGDSAKPVVGDGRIAQLLNFPIIPLSIILSSGAVPYEKDSSVLEIFPPFRLEAKLGGSNVQLVESGSDADFRALNARSQEAQEAGRNLYKQRYLENTGKRGDLRISEVIAGDPVLVVSCCNYKYVK